jgi:hypothetical protein
VLDVGTVYGTVTGTDPPGTHLGDRDVTFNTNLHRFTQLIHVWWDAARLWIPVTQVYDIFPRDKPRSLDIRDSDTPFVFPY